MLDKRTKQNISTLDAKAQPLFTAFAEAAKVEAEKHGCDYIMICGNRTYEQQSAIFRIGRRGIKGEKIVTRAAPGYSNHNFGIAGDFGVFKDGKYLDTDNKALAERVHKACGALAKAHGLEWGGLWREFTDMPHYEASTGLTMRQKREKFAKFGSVL